MALFQTPLALIPAIFFWQWPDFMTWIWLVALATAGTLGHLLYTKAMQLAEVSQMQPIEFIRLPNGCCAGFSYSEKYQHTGLGLVALSFSRDSVCHTSRSKAFPKLNIYKLLFHLSYCLQILLITFFEHLVYYFFGLSYICFRINVPRFFFL